MLRRKINTLKIIRYNVDNTIVFFRHRKMTFNFVIPSSKRWQFSDRSIRPAPPDFATYGLRPDRGGGSRK